MTKTQNAMDPEVICKEVLEIHFNIIILGAHWLFIIMVLNRIFDRVIFKLIKCLYISESMFCYFPICLLFSILDRKKCHFLLIDGAGK